jgi:hypothetical protein
MDNIKHDEIMKKIYSLFCLALVACIMLLSSCQEDEKSPARPGTVRFTLRRQATVDGANGRIAETLPEGSILHVSIQDAAGEEIYRLHGLTLVNLGDYVISEPLALNTGDYVLTEFIVTHDVVSYVTPQEGSPMAEWVDDPLPIEFTVEDNTVAGLEVQVLPFEETDTPEDFGYVGFAIDVTPYPFFNLSVFAPASTGFEFTPVQAYILEGSDTIYREALPAGSNKIAFVGDLYDDTFTVYQLVLMQPGYRRYTLDFRLEALLEYLTANGKKALEVTLQPAFTFGTLYTNEAAFDIYGSAIETLTVDWGDGTVEQITPAIENHIVHPYAGGYARYFVSVYGSDLNKVEELQFAYDDGSLQSIALDYLPGLRKFELVTAVAPAVIDFSQNPNIQHIDVLLANARSIVLAENAAIPIIRLWGNGNTFLSSSLDHIIDVSYRAAVEGRLPVGTLGLSTWYEMPGPEKLIATPSPAALEKLRALRDVYGWHISPDDF